MRRPVQHQQRPTFPWQIFAPPDTNAGIPYIFPWQPPFFRGNRQNVALMPTTFIALTPDTLPPNIDGMAWWYPFDQPPQKKTKVTAQQTEMRVLIPSTLPVAIAGSAWFVSWQPPHFPRKVPAYLQPRPEWGIPIIDVPWRGFYNVKISGGGR
jgi:hypothetical protein